MDVHDESTVDLWLCLLLDVCGDALWNDSTNTKMSRLIFVSFEVCVPSKTIYDLQNFVSFQVTIL